MAAKACTIDLNDAINSDCQLMHIYTCIKTFDPITWSIVMTLARLGCITPSERKTHKIASFLVEYQLDLYITASLKN